MNELQWISVPGGTDADGAPLLRVLIVPRLEGADLEGAGMADWPPAALHEAPRLSLEWRSQEGGPATSTTAAPGDVRFAVEAGLWGRFFAPTMELGGDGRATAPPAMPRVDPSAQTAAEIDKTFGGAAEVPLPADGEAPPAYGEAVRKGLAPWEGAAEAPPPPPPPPPPSGDCPPEPGFHRIVSLLREHPAVLRALGLIFELRVAPPTGFEGAGQVRVLWPGAPAAPAPQVVSPWTLYAAGFLPFSRSGAISRGMVTLTPDLTVGDPVAGGSWALATVDLEGGARKLRDAAQALPGEDQAPARLPAMRTAGIQLLRVDREHEIARRRGVALENHARGSLEDQVLDADELVLGYRVDVKRGGGDWRSLHQRLATYRCGENAELIGAVETPEEGHVKVNGAVKDPDGSLRTSEVVARWSGWSLAVPPPPFDAPDGASRAQRRDCLPFDFSWDFKVPPGSLPQLRFAETYAVRARVADMAGGGLGHEDSAADRCAIGGQGYRRYEPVPSPGVRLEVEPADHRLGPGEAFDRVVVRSAPGIGIDDFEAHNPDYVGRPRRALDQPQASLAIAEQHRMLDHADVDQSFALVQRALVADEAVRFGLEPGEGPLPDPAAAGITAVGRREPGAPATALESRDWGAAWPALNPAKIVELREPEAGKPVAIWEHDMLVVRLAAAQQVTLELSSSLTGNFRDQFELQEAMPPDSKKAAEAGRHPLVTPALPVTFVHAVRKPIHPPDPTAELVPRTRATGDAFALLDPKPVLLGLDADSAAQLDVTATWTERRDDAVEQVTEAGVRSIPIDRGATALGGPVRHEFGDTRHRDVAYTLTAVSRFRQYFKVKEEEAADPLAFVQRETLQPISILSTARPPTPVVLATRPAFAWQDSFQHEGGGVTLRRQRQGGRLRVELARPWYVTGDGECLAVTVWDRSGGVTPADGVAALVSEAGRDPIWDTPGPERWPTASDLSGAVADAVSLTPVEAEAKVLAVPFEPWFDGDRWCADVELPGIASSSYAPFVRLAVARYQPQSIDEHHLSPIVRTEMTQLLPDRTLTVSQVGEAVQVQLAGIGPAGPRANRVDVVLEQCTAGADAATVELSALGAVAEVPVWTPVPGVTLQTELGAAPVELPLPAGPGALRLRVREVEQIGGESVLPAQVATPGELSERVVFADTVDLPLG